MDLHEAILTALPALRIDNRKQPCAPSSNIDPYQIGRILKADEVYKLKSTGDICPICLSEDDDHAVVHQGYQGHSQQQKYIRLHGCAHNFHDQCLRKWIVSESGTSLKDNCPMCRQTFKRITQIPLKHSSLLQNCNTFPSSNGKRGDSEGQQIETNLLLAQLRLSTSVRNVQRAEHELETCLNSHHMPKRPKTNTRRIRRFAPQKDHHNK
jgi:hypothetical protein